MTEEKRQRLKCVSVSSFFLGGGTGVFSSHEKIGCFFNTSAIFSKNNNRCVCKQNSQFFPFNFLSLGFVSLFRGILLLCACLTFYCCSPLRLCSAL